jgi:hypothetical protein
VTAVAGVGLIVTSGLLFWYFLPREGQEQPRFKKALNEMLLLLSIIVAISMGLPLLLQGLFG